MSLGEDVLRMVIQSPIYLGINNGHEECFPALLIGDGTRKTGFIGEPIWIGQGGN